jgi:homoserine dehydrogenase
VKLIGVCERTETGVNARVHPAMIPLEHPLSGIRGATNAIFIEGPTIDSLLFAGPGAGGEPTATAVLGDMIDAARETLAGAQVTPRIRFSPGEIVDFEDISTEWYIRLVVDDKPGVLATIASIFGDAGVSIKSVWQEGGETEAALIVVTHRAIERAQRIALEALEVMDDVIDVGSVIRVLGGDR